jgi:uncharacterized protein (TIGR02118 family)
VSDVKLVVLYPCPADVEQFNRDYAAHLKLLHEKMRIPEDVQPYAVTRFVETPQGKPSFGLMFTMPFPSAQALQQAMTTPEMQEVSADAARISTGGAPVVLVGVEGA